MKSETLSRRQIRHAHVFFAATLTLSLSLFAEVPAEVKTVVQAASAKLTSAEKIELTAKRTMSPELADARGQFAEAKLSVAALRPNCFKTSASPGEGEARQFFFDGKKITLFDSDSGAHAEANLEGSIDDLIDKIEEKFGFSPPVVDLFHSKLGEAVLEGDLYDGELLGKKDGTVHLKLSNEEIAWDIWIGEDDQLPKKLHITFLHMEGAPTLTVEGMEWNLSANLGEKDFEFKAPDGAVEADLLTLDQIESQLKK